MEKKATPRVQTAAVPQDTLSVLCQGDEQLHSAMSYFLYLRPEEQFARLGTTEQLVQRATEAMGSGDLVRARVDYADAAWIELYKGNKANVKLFLEGALGLHDVDGPGMLSTLRLNTLLLKLEKVISIAQRYYNQNNIPNPAAPLGSSGSMPEQIAIATS
jgi:hypothetical protein